MSMILPVLPLADVAVRRAALSARPLTPGQLHRWVKHVLGFDVPRAPLIAGHDAPFDYLCHAFFEDLRPAPFRNALVWAARGSGKTQLGAIATLLDLLFKPGIGVCILGGSFAQSSRMHHHLRRMLHDEAFIDLIDGRITLEHVSLRNGSRVEVLSQSQTAVRGQRVHRLRCDEVELFEPDVWEAAQMVTRSGRCGEVEVHAGVEALSTMHRPFGLMSRLTAQAWPMSAAQSSTRLFRWSAIDVLEHCPPARACKACGLYHDGCGGAAKRVECRGFLGIDDALDQRLRVSPQTWRAEMLCERPDVSDCVYPEFDEDVHVFGDADDMPGTAGRCSCGAWLGGLDFGFRSPSVLLLATLDGCNVLRVMHELHERSCVTARMIELAQACCAARGVSIHPRAPLAENTLIADAAARDPRPSLRWIAADPAGLSRNEQTGVSSIALWRRAGFAIRTRGSTIDAGIEMVRARLAGPAGSLPGLLVHRRCGNLIRALREYHFDADRPHALNPVKDGPDHACDALRYLVVNLESAGATRAKTMDY